MYSINLQQIKMLQSQNDSLVSNLISIQADTIPFKSISVELKINYPEVESFEYGVYKTTDFKTTTEIPTFHLKWNTKTRNRKSQQNKIQQWLKHRLQLKEVRVVSF